MFHCTDFACLSADLLTPYSLITPLGVDTSVGGPLNLPNPSWGIGDHTVLADSQISPLSPCSQYMYESDQWLGMVGSLASSMTSPVGGVSTSPRGVCGGSMQTTQAVSSPHLNYASHSFSPSVEHMSFRDCLLHQNSAPLEFDAPDLPVTPDAPHAFKATPSDLDFVFDDADNVTGTRGANEDWAIQIQKDAFVDEGPTLSQLNSQDLSILDAFDAFESFGGVGLLNDSSQDAPLVELYQLLNQQQQQQYQQQLLREQRLPSPGNAAKNSLTDAVILESAISRTQPVTSSQVGLPVTACKIMHSSKQFSVATHSVSFAGYESQRNVAVVKNGEKGGKFLYAESLDDEISIKEETEEREEVDSGGEDMEFKILWASRGEDEEGEKERWNNDYDGGGNELGENLEAEQNYESLDGSVSEVGSVLGHAARPVTSLQRVMTSSRGAERRYFWQYNAQAKGPKGKRLCQSLKPADPHVLNDFEDPVFDPDQNETRYKHNGKARRGDGNDVTPNPRKLFLTGRELAELNRLIDGLGPPPGAELPSPARARSTREKNKYASRACRLKKKAQHEANKLKLHGLEREHRQLMTVLTGIKKEIVRKVKEPVLGDGERMTSKLEKLIKSNLTVMIAGHTIDYVNTVLQKVADGDRTGGLALDD